MRTKELEPKPNNLKIDAHSKALEKGRNSTHFVFHNKGEWDVKKPGSKSKKSFSNKSEAIDYAIKYAKSKKNDVVVFDKESKSIELIKY